MFARLLALVSSIALAGCAGTGLSAGPIAPGPASIVEHSLACAGKDGWSDPAPPVRIYGNLYDVGSCGITVLLLAGASGHVLIDGGPADIAPQVLANIDRLGFAPTDVRWILSSHEHFDHVAALAELKRATGARLAARAAAATVLATGKAEPEDPQAGRLPGFAPVAVDRLIADGALIAVGDLRLTVHATPGHSPGSTSWTFSACEGRTCRDVAYADSLTSISDDGYRFTDHPAYVEAFRNSIDRIATLPCAILVTPHPSASRLFERLAGKRPLVDPQACQQYAKAAADRLDQRLADEAAAK
ncbi:subclass B3 metallo-beta-lactamase [Novosphingobium sp. Gsoil 351]|uniref:subclass B3 metallo-beta-lactamase n=1 Tax=Novosphingobium sp. Gsoil 351 TaxID=2675225 RepID=UPI0012B4E7D4|nr:subclass B3 metallo-beta-lactamase [Novosphingobium sp. Gsoil 351]QGN53395.1 subclass B3 metallo-beta-lactamase [Novosphingobium sp. Gsoil 351]